MLQPLGSHFYLFLLSGVVTCGVTIRATTFYVYMWSCGSFHTNKHKQGTPLLVLPNQISTKLGEFIHASFPGKVLGTL